MAPVDLGAEVPAFLVPAPVMMEGPVCINCPDMVADCWEPGCVGPEFLPDGRRNLYSRSRKFYLDDSLCEHLRAEHGVATGRELDHLLRPDDLDEFLAEQMQVPPFRRAFERSEWVHARWHRRFLNRWAPRLLRTASR
jgi:hypothetical protein